MPYHGEPEGVSRDIRMKSLFSEARFSIVKQAFKEMFDFDSEVLVFLYPLPPYVGYDDLKLRIINR